MHGMSRCSVEGQKVKSTARRPLLSSEVVWDGCHILGTSGLGLFSLMQHHFWRERERGRERERELRQKENMSTAARTTAVHPHSVVYAVLHSFPAHGRIFYAGLDSMAITRHEGIQCQWFSLNPMDKHQH